MIGALIGDAGDNSGSTSYYSLPETGATEQLDSDAQSLPSVQHSQPEFPVNSFVTPEQYARPDIGHKYRLGAEQHITFHRQSPHSSSLIFSSKQPSSKPYSCPCSNQGCMLQFSTKAEALASHRQHESGKQLQQIQFLTPYWTGNSPQEIAFKPDGPIVSTRQGRRTEPDTTTSVSVHCILRPVSLVSLMLKLAESRCACSGLKL